MEWKIIYVGSAEDKQYDQVLDCIMVGPVPVGVNKFVFQADAPNTSLIPRNDLDGVTVALLTCSYRDCEFVRVGYYVNNEYIDPLTGLVIEDSLVDTGDVCALDGVMEGDGTFGLKNGDDVNGSNVAGGHVQTKQHQEHQEQQEKPTQEKKFENLMRNILADRPRVTRFPIKWDTLLDETVTSTEQINEVANSDEVMTDFAAIGVSINDGGDVVVDEDDYEFEEDEDEDDEDDDYDEDDEDEDDDDDDDDEDEDLQTKMEENFSPLSPSLKATSTSVSPSFPLQPIEESTTSIKEPISGGGVDGDGDGAIEDTTETSTMMMMDS